MAVARLTHGHVSWILGRADTGDIEVAGIYEPDAEVVERYAAEFGFDRRLVHNDLGKMLDAAKPRAVLAFGSIAEHLAVVEAAAPRGIHVMVEKPLAFRSDDARAIAVLARRHGIHVLTNYETTWYPSGEAAFALVHDESAIGAIHKVVIRDGHFGPCAAHLFAVAVPGLLLIAIIFGGVRSGIFTATESSCIAVLYALLITIFVYRQMTWEDFVHATMGAVRTTAMVLLIIRTAAAFSWLMAFLRVPATLVAWMQTLSDNPIVILLLLNVLMLLLGTFMDMGPTIIITTPIFLPIAQAYGVDPVHFGVIMILNYGIGLNTPPVGGVQFVACAVGKISVWEAMRSIWPFYGAGLVVLLMVTYIPALSLWLPSVFK
jgi:TRAP-type C4-dicarboxylate transport system permease large subunit